MIPLIGAASWFLIPLRPTKFSPAKLAKVKVVDGEIVQGFALERREPPRSSQRLHWSAGLGSWAESI